MNIVKLLMKKWHGKEEEIRPTREGQGESIAGRESAQIQNGLFSLDLRISHYLRLSLMSGISCCATVRSRATGKEKHKMRENEKKANLKSNRKEMQ